jgi:hypothetical protein
LYERVVALELFDRLFLTLDNTGELIDSSAQSRLVDCDVVQTVERNVDRIDLLRQRIIVPQQAGAGRKQIAAQHTLVLSKPIELGERSVERLGVAVHGAQRQPRQDQGKQRHAGYHGYRSHGDAAFSGAPR